MKFSTAPRKGLIMKDVYSNKIEQIPESKYRDLLVIISNRRSSDSAISRRELAYRMNMSDREVRELITRARKSRFPIIINHNEGGYYLSNDINEIQEFRNREIHSRINDLKATDDGMAEAIEFLKEFSPDQITIDEVVGR